jgi:hypothetical protein
MNKITARAIFQWEHVTNRAGLFGESRIPRTVKKHRVLLEIGGRQSFVSTKSYETEQKAHRAAERINSKFNSND